MFTNVVRAFLCKTTSKGKISKRLRRLSLLYSQEDPASALNIAFETFQDCQYLSFWAIKPLNHKAISERQKLTKYAHSVTLSTPTPMEPSPHENKLFSCLIYLLINVWFFVDGPNYTKGSSTFAVFNFFTVHVYICWTVFPGIWRMSESMTLRWIYKYLSFHIPHRDSKLNFIDHCPTPSLASPAEAEPVGQGHLRNSDMGCADWSYLFSWISLL